MAANGINVKMGVSGVGQFKQNINSARQSIKTLDAELALNEKQFKASGDAQAYMQQKSELLQKKIEEQKAVISEAEKALQQMADNGVSKTSKAYQDMQQQLIRAKGEMIDAQMQIENVGEAGQEAGNGVDAMNQQLKRIGDGISVQNVTDGLDKITDKMEAVIKKAWDMGKAIVNATLGAGSWADELATTADQYEITPEQLYRMRETARLIDTDADTILAAQDKMRRGLEKKDKSAMGTLAYLGIDPTGKSDLDIFWEAGEAIAALGKEEDKVSYAQSLWGKSWREMMPLFHAGRKEYEETMQKWSWIGDEGFQNLTEMDDAYQGMQSEWEAFQHQFEAAMAPALTGVMEILTDLMKQFNEYLTTPEGKEMLDSLTKAVEGLFSDLTKIDPQEVMEGFKGVFDAIVDGLKWLTENSGTVVTALETVVAGWAALKITGGVLEILKVIQGLQWMKENPNIKMPNIGGGGNGSGGGVGDIAGGTGAATGAEKTGLFAKIGGGLSGLFGAGSSFSMMGGLSTLGPIGIMIAAGAAAAHGINENLKDANLNAIYGGNGAEGGLIDTMSEDAWRLAAKYFQIYQDESKTGTEEAFAARESLLKQLESEGYVNNEQAVSLLEQVFDNYLNEIDPDGLIERMTQHNPEFFQETEAERDLRAATEKMESAAAEISGETEGRKQSNSEMTAAATSMQGMPALVEAAIIRGMSGIRLYIDGYAAGQALAGPMGRAMGTNILTMSR